MKKHKKQYYWYSSTFEKKHVFFSIVDEDPEGRVNDIFYNVFNKNKR